MTLDQVRHFALSLPEAAEEPHFEYISFRIKRKIFATVPPEAEYLHLFVSDDQREQAIAEHPDFLENLRWGGRVVGLRALLPAARPHVVKMLLAQAWSRKAPKRLVALANSKDPSAVGLTPDTLRPPPASRTSSPRSRRPC